MAKIKKPSEVVGQGSFLDTFSVAYGLYDMYHKVQTRKRQGEEYISQSVNNIFSNFQANPNDSNVLDSTIEQLENLGSRVSVSENSPAFHNFRTKLNILKTERQELDLANTHFINVQSGRYDAENYLHIDNQGWSIKGTLEDIEDSDLKTRKHQMKASPTNLKLKEDIKQLKKDRDSLKKMNRLDDSSKEVFNSKIKELEILQGYVGYDGKLSMEDIHHAKSGKTLSQMWDSWNNIVGNQNIEIDKLENEINEIITLNAATPFAGEESLPQESKDTIARKRALISDAKSLIKDAQSNLYKYKFDYKYLGEGPASSSAQDRVENILKDFTNNEDNNINEEINEDNNEEINTDIDEEKDSSGVFLSDGTWYKETKNDVGDTVLVKPSPKEIRDAKKEISEKKIPSFGNHSNRVLRRAINTAFQKMSRKNREKFDKEKIMKSIKAGRGADEKYKESTFDIPEELLELLNPKWQTYINENKITP